MVTSFCTAARFIDEDSNLMPLMFTMKVMAIEIEVPAEIKRIEMRALRQMSFTLATSDLEIRVIGLCRQSSREKEVV